MAQDSISRPAVERLRVAQLFSRRPDRSFVVGEIAARMSERLDLMRIEPDAVLDLGSGAGADLNALQERYPKAVVMGVDLAPRSPRGAASLKDSLGSWLRSKKKPLSISADSLSLPLASGSVDLIWSNCMLHWIPDAEPAIAEWSRVLKPGAALLFSCLGPDSLKQVRIAFEAIDVLPHTLAFTDLHDYGDMLAGHGFAQPVMDAEVLTLTYDSAEAFWADVRALGGNPLIARRRGLIGRTAAKRLDAALERLRNAKGQLELSFEIVYGHAWKGTPRGRSDGLPVIALPKSLR